MAVHIGLVGTGTVGCGFVHILQKHHDDFMRHYGLDLQISRVCSHKDTQAKALGLGDKFTPDFHDIINDPAIDIVVEVIGGTTDARDVIMGALSAGKHVVTANKALMASDGKEIMDLADAKHKNIGFEASVGGGIPIIEPMKHMLISNQIEQVKGIVNGTTNYMLTRMAQDGLTYEQALHEAQDAGFAEADPTADVDGLDAAAKIAILSSIAFNSRVTMGHVYAEGIRGISPIDLATAKDMGYCVKLLAIANRMPSGIDVRVHPTMLPLQHPLSNVNGVDNAIYVVGDFVGQTMFFGEGAGSGPAASSVMGDVLETARLVQNNIAPLVGCTCTDEMPIIPVEELSMRYYIRFVVMDNPGVLAAMANVFAHDNVSVRSVIQRGHESAGTVDMVYVTHTAREADMRGVLDEIQNLDHVLAPQCPPTVIRVDE